MSIPVYGIFEGGKTSEERWGEKEDKPGADVVSSVARCYTTFALCGARAICVVFYEPRSPVTLG